MLRKYSNELVCQSLVSSPPDSAGPARQRRRRRARYAVPQRQRYCIATPRGLFACTGVQNLAVPGHSLSTTCTTPGLVLAANVEPARVGWLMTSRELRADWHKLKDTGDRYLVQADSTETGAYCLLGHGVTVTNPIPDTTWPRRPHGRCSSTCRRSAWPATSHPP